MLDNYNIPYVFCTDYYEGMQGEVSVVMSDLEEGMYRLTKEVIGMGYREIAYLTGDDAVVSLRLRKNGFARAAAESNVDSYIYGLEKLSYRAAHDAIGNIVKDRPDTDAFVCGNDMIAAGTLNAISEMNCSVPEVGVAGFDNVIFSRIAFPRISTVEQDIKGMAKKSVELLMKKDKKKRDVILPTKIIKRESLKGEKDEF